MVIPKKVALVGAAAAGVAAFGCATALWWVHDLVRDKVSSAAASRGLQATVDSVSFRPTGILLGGVRLEGPALLGELDHVRVSLAWGDVLSGDGARESIQTIAIQGGKIALRVRPELREMLGRDSGPAVAEDHAPGAQSPTERTQPKVFVEGLELTVEDADGVLGRLRGLHADLNGSLLSVRAASAHAFEGGPEEIELDALEIRADRTRRELSRATVAGGQVILRSASAAGASWRGRLSHALSTVRGDRAERAADEASDADPTWTDRLAPDASVDVRSITVRSEGARAAPVAQSLSFRLQRTAPDVFEATGSGTLSDGGDLEWDLRLSPAALRGEGRVRFSGLPLALCTPFLPRLPWHRPEDGRLDGELEIHGSGPSEPIAFRGRVAARRVALSSPRIAPTPVRNIGFELKGEGAWHPLNRRLHLEEAELRLGEASAGVQGDFTWSSDGWAIEARATLPPTRCDDAVGAIPRDMLGDLGTFSFEGSMSGRIDVAIDSSRLAETTLDLDVADGCRFETVPPEADLRRVEGPFQHRVLEPDGTWFEMTTGPGTGNWVSIFAVSPFLIHAVIAHEDASFFRHGGFAPWSIREALVRNLEEGRFVYGASTITMQLAKNLFLHREKTLARKVQEVLLTWWLESSLEKQEILELYLNIIEYGPQIYGLREASFHFFGCDPALLSPAQGAYLASILPGPKSYYNHYTRGSLSNSMRSRMTRFLEHMRNRERIDDAALAFGLAELETFGFRRDGEGRAPLRVVEGTAAPLPFEVEWESFDEDEEAGWEEWVDDLPLPANGGATSG